jgi:hypothetical protein
VEYTVKRGVGALRIKEYFVAQSDGDTLAGVVAGPFQSELQCRTALDALSPLYFGRLHCIGGHLVAWSRPPGWFIPFA